MNLKIRMNLCAFCLRCRYAIEMVFGLPVHVDGSIVLHAMSMNLLAHVRKNPLCEGAGVGAAAGNLVCPDHWPIARSRVKMIQ